MPLRRLALPLAFALGACGGYQPGSLQVADPGGAVRTVGCLDIAVEPVHDAEAVGPVAGITFANRCDAAVEVDLGAIRASGEMSDGRVVDMRLFDPDRAVGPALLEARRTARENLEYQMPSSPATIPASLCLDLSGVDLGVAPDRPVIACIDGAATPVLAGGEQPGLGAAR